MSGANERPTLLRSRLTAGLGVVLALTVAVTVVLAGCSKDSAASGSSSTGSSPAGSSGGAISAADRAQAVKSLLSGGAPFTQTEAGCIVDSAYPHLSPRGRDQVLSGDTATDNMTAGDKLVVSSAVSSCVSLQTLLKGALSTLTPAQATCITNELEADRITAAQVANRDPAAISKLSAAATRCALPAGSGTAAATSTTTAGG